MSQQISSLRGADAEDVEAKRQWVREHYDANARHQYETLEGKLRLLEVILENGWIEQRETLKLQCLGIAFGDALAQALGMQWATVEDEYGRDPALVLEGTSIIMFPLTAISKRVEAGESIHVRELFESACATVERIRAEGA